jgi:23S rRNA (adenine2030-N6)-methyltransferase
MLAYRHAFHAGNHADVLKHVVLVRLLRHLNLKDKPYRVIDTHAGAGSTALHEADARKTGEYLNGIQRLWQRQDLHVPLPDAVADYLQLVKRHNTGGTLEHYPGSPVLARMLLRGHDQLRLFELHPADHTLLQQMLGASKGVEVVQADGFAALKGQLPPSTRRALVLIDPSYEGLGDYARVVDALGDALERFAAGMYMVWYPVVQKPGALPMLRALRTLAPKGWLHARLEVQAPDASGFGLLGSGVFVINPPYTLHAELHRTLPWLANVLGQHAGACHRLEQRAG